MSKWSRTHPPDYVPASQQDKIAYDAAGWWLVNSSTDTNGNRRVRDELLVTLSSASSNLAGIRTGAGQVSPLVQALETASSISARYWQLQILTWSGWTEAAVSEIELALLGQTKYTPSSIVASTTYSGLPASGAIDGDKSTFWAASNAATPQTLTLDYGADVAVNVLRLRGRAGGAITSFRLKYSTDNVNWTTVIDASGLPTATEDATKSYPLPGITTGNKILWRLKPTTIESGSTASMAELILRNETGGAQVATGGRPYAQAVYAGDTTKTPDLAFDGNAATFWNGNNTTSWLAYEFPGSQGLVEFAVQARTSLPAQTPKDFTLEYSADGITWTTAATVTGQTGWTVGQIRTFSIP